MLVLSLLLNENAFFFAEMDVDRKNIPEKKILALPIILRSKPFWCLGVGYSNHTNIKEQLNLKLNLKLKIDAHGKKKVEFKPRRCV